ncbi:hypothetical protein GGR50DRAFT_693959 [Xylaria sp. CBS 124048]|nr:hypothetical protein GGR50DRAFT_693959 [Xylaria sp. CBS 124048]
MASVSQPHSVLSSTRFYDLNLHNWKDPVHFLRCSNCRNHRHRRSQIAEAKASETGHRCAISVGQPHHYRVLSISPRLGCKGPFNSNQLKQPFPTITKGSKQVTFKIPCLPEQSPSQPKQSRSRKRSATCINDFNPAVHFLPGNFKSRAGFDSRPVNKKQSPQSRAASEKKSNKIVNMPGAWPSPVDEPNPIFLDDSPRRPTPSPEPDDGFRSIAHGLFRVLGGLSAAVLGAISDTIWRTVPATGQEQTVTSTQTVDNSDPGSPKRPRFGKKTSRKNVSAPSDARSLARAGRGQPGKTTRRERNGRGRSSRHSILKADADFNHRGHFSVDMAYATDSDEDKGEVGDAMVLDSPHQASQQTRLDHMTGDFPAQPIITTNDISKPNSNFSVTAARRAVRLFPNYSVTQKTQLEAAASVFPTVDQLRHKVAESTTVKDTPVTDGKGHYGDIVELSPGQVEHSLPGLGEDGLPANDSKADHLKMERLERIRKEEIAARDAALTALGFRLNKSALIHIASPEWVNRAFYAAKNGRFDPSGIPDSVELLPRDFGKLVPPTAWLNDNCVHSTLCCLADYVNKKAGVRPKVDTPKCVTISSLYWTAFCEDHGKLYPRPFARKWNMRPDNLLDIDTILIPVNLGFHWTLIVIRPARRAISYLDSFRVPNKPQISHAYEWLGLFLGDKYIADDWKTEEMAIPKQSNAWDCGMFVISNSICVALGIGPMCYSEESMPMQRLRIAAMLMNGGFHGEFDLSHL